MMSETGLAIVVSVGIALLGLLGMIWGKLRAIETKVDGMSDHCDRERERQASFDITLGKHERRIGALETKMEEG